MKNKIYAVGITAFMLVWFSLVGASWFGPKQDRSLAERRRLAQAPELRMVTYLAKDEKDSSGNITKKKSFMSLFEEYTLDQFPLRDQFRQVKSVYQYYVMQQKDNNGYYVVDNYVAEQLYPLDTVSLNSNTEVINNICDKYLKNINTYVAIVPDKGDYLAEKSGNLALDYSVMFSTIAENTNENVNHVDLTEILSQEDYYYTDTHWRQERIVPVAEELAEAMAVTVQSEDAYTKELVENPFYGVYYSFVALPMNPEQMYLMHSDILDDCTVRCMDDRGQWQAISMYDMTKAQSNDLYDIFFSGNQPMIEIVNKKATSSKELVVFGDSFGRSLVPLLAQGYRKITVVDLRLTNYNELDMRLFANYSRTDVLFLYSTISMNQSISRY